ncbi:hypothetical protein M569_12988 [Genlisea aurea]|uniref:Formin-like protein n=1 Tax=Genlisea aurea TaxID=192259 RepID=S8CBN8_9LAMI|nr:hypothetical protein M569_12988 [Genlisea aurea]
MHSFFNEGNLEVDFSEPEKIPFRLPKSMFLNSRNIVSQIIPANDVTAVRFLGSVVVLEMLAPCVVDSFLPHEVEALVIEFRRDEEICRNLSGIKAEQQKVYKDSEAETIDFLSCSFIPPLSENGRRALKLWNRYPTVVFTWDGIPRRLLRAKRIYKQAVNSVSSPSPAPSPGFDQVPAPSPSPTPQSPSPSPSPSEAPEPALADSPLPSGGTSYRLPLPKAAPPPPPPPMHDTATTENKFMTAAAIATSAAGLVLIALLFILCTKKSRFEVKDGQRDEKPLLNFSSGDLSRDKAHAMDKDSSAAGMGKSTDIDEHSYLAKAESRAAHGGSTGQNISLPLPPGRMASSPAPPPPPPPKPPAPAPPPPPPKARRPPNPPLPAKPSPLGRPRQRSSSEGVDGVSDESEAPKAKLKPFFWDKVLANPDHSMVWHEIKAGSFQFNEEMMESLFGYAPVDKAKNERRKDSSGSVNPPSHFIQIIDPKKSQNLAILLKALNVTSEEVCDALREGHELPAELIQTLLRMAPSTDEELKLRLYDGDPSHLGLAETFLKVMVNIPFAFKRLEALLFVSNFQEEFPSIKESFETLEVACNELRNSRLFLKLLEAVLKTGNRMNDGTYRGGAQAFKLDTLLKLSDVKGTDGKTTLLHFVVLEIIRSEGVREARRLRGESGGRNLSSVDLAEEEFLPPQPPSSPVESAEYHRDLGLRVVSGLSDELQNVKKAAVIDCESLGETVSKLRNSLARTKGFLEKEMEEGGGGGGDFREAVASFVRRCESDMESLTEEESRIMALVKSTGDYFHGKAGKDEGLHLFVIVRDFLLMLEKACQDVRQKAKLPTRKRESSSISSSSHGSPSKSPVSGNRSLFPALRAREIEDDDDDDDFGSDRES